MTRLHATLFTAVLAVAAAACAAAGDDELIPPLDTHDRLAEPVTFYLAPEDTKANLTAALGDDETVADLVVRDGSIDVSVDDADQLVLDELTIAFEDIALPKTIYPGDLVLTDVNLHLAQPLACADTFWYLDDDSATCTTTADLTLDWNVRIGGILHPLASQTLGDVVLDADVFRGHDRLVLEVSAHADGVVWSYLGQLELSDLGIWFRGYDYPQIIP